MCALWTSLFKLDNCDSFLPLNAIVGKLNVGVIFVFFKEQLTVFKLIICSEKRSLGAPEDIEVTLNNYFSQLLSKLFFVFHGQRKTFSVFYTTLIGGNRNCSTVP